MQQCEFSGLLITKDPLSVFLKNPFCTFKPTGNSFLDKNGNRITFSACCEAWHVALFATPGFTIERSLGLCGWRDSCSRGGKSWRKKSAYKETRLGNEENHVELVR